MYAVVLVSAHRLDVLGTSQRNVQVCQMGMDRGCL
jgi:hypothetical protein